MLKQVICFLIFLFAVCNGGIGACWATWSRCTRATSWGNNILWQTCNDRCYCLGWTSGTCQLQPSSCPISSQAYQCKCSSTRRGGSTPWWCGF